MIPLQILDLTGIGTGGAIMIVGFLAVTLWAIIEFRNPAAAVMWGVTALTLVLVGVYEIRDELFWFALMLTLVLVIVGVTARVSRGR